MNKLRNIFFMCFAVYILFSISSCYTIRVNSTGVMDTLSNGDEYRDTIIHLIGWQGDKTWYTKLCEEKALHEVSVDLNILQSLANVITIGFWKPVKVRYICSSCPKSNQ